MTDELLSRLLQRGDQIAIEAGRLAITALSGKPVPENWIEENHEPLAFQIVKQLGIDAFRYCNYSTGHYGKYKSGGITLQFTNLLSQSSAYAVFNADLSRDRTTAYGKKGSSLPEGHFRVGKKSTFYKFWLSTGLALPRRISEFHYCMPKLNSLVFTFDTQDERVEKKTIQLANVPYDHIQKSSTNDASHPHISTGKSLATPRQATGKVLARTTGKEISQAHEYQGLQANSTTGGNNYGNTVIREYGNKGSNTLDNIIPITKRASEDKSIDDWLSDYESK